MKTMIEDSFVIEMQFDAPLTEVAEYAQEALDEYAEREAAKLNVDKVTVEMRGLFSAGYNKYRVVYTQEVEDENI